MADPQVLYNSIGLKLENAAAGQMFGKPCLKINGKAFTGFFNGEMVFKLQGDAHRKAISQNGTKLFDPSGKGPANERMGASSFNLFGAMERTGDSCKEPRGRVIHRF